MTLINFEKLLSTLADHEVEFLVVGGISAYLQGVPVTTNDLDLLYHRRPSNLERLARALHGMRAVYRMKPEVVPDAARLDTPGHHHLMTDWGPLDLLGTVVGGRGYPELVGNTVTIRLDHGQTVKILDLPTLIDLKEELGRDTDRAVLPVLRRVLAEKNKS